MAPKIHRSASEQAWELARRQHGVVSRGQLLGLGFSVEAIRHRIERGRLYPIHAGVYAVGRPELTQQGRWMAAVLSCGPDAVLSHQSAAELWQIRKRVSGLIEVSAPVPGGRRRPGITVHRRSSLNAEQVTRHHGIPVTTPVCTLVDMAPRLTRDQREAAINEADMRGLVDPDELRAALDAFTGWRGVAILRETLDRRTFVLTQTKLERLFLPIARRAGLPLPQTQRWVNGAKVDFFWPDLGLVVETDGLRYHRTPAKQAKDLRRDQEHLASGLTPMRFSHEQVKFETHYVEAKLTKVARRLTTIASI